MAIIRSKIARQLLAEGGVSLDDAKMMAPKGEFLAYINPKEAGILRSMGGSGRITPMGIPSFTEDEEDQLAMDAPDYSSLDFEEQAAVDRGEPTAQMSTMARDFQGFGPGDNLSDLQAPTFFQNLGTGVSNLVGQGRRGENIMNFLNRSTAQTLRGQLGLGRRGDINYVLEQLQANKGDPVAMGLSNKQFEIGQKLIDAGIKDETDIRNMTQSQFDTLFPGPQTGEGGDNEFIRKIRAPITEKIEEEPKRSDIENLLRYRGSAFEDGGEVRDGYFGGGITKAFKKAVGAVKKVAKSPVGKVALLAGLNYAPTLFNKQTVLQGLGNNKMFKDLLLKEGKDKFTFGNLSPFSLIGIPTVASYLFSKKEEDEDETLPTVANTDPAFQNLINYYGGSTRFAAEGGDIDEAPMKDMPQQEMASNPSSFAELNMLSLDLFGRPYDQLNDSEQEILMEYFSKSKDMPERTMAAGGGMMNPNDEMLNLGGNEMDLRGGGFVPLGEYEKKDDVPARLSKNEFVFTADAVRAAGGGSVDRGADLMYKTMKNLENKIA